jgi:cytochrome c-type biogenesis protein CcmH
MSDNAKSIIAIAVSAAALVFIVVGLISSPTAEPTAQERIDALASVIRCPFCNGESLAESSSSVAADYRQLISERVDAGLTDDQIRQEFVENFGEAILLDTSTSRWSLTLWLVPLVVLLVGAGVIVWMRRTSARTEEVPIR